MVYAFRVRFVLPESSRVDDESMEIPLHETPEGERVVLRPTKRGEAFKDSSVLGIFGSPYASEEAAQEQAQKWSDWMRLALALNRVGADFGDRDGGFGGMSRYALDKMGASINASFTNASHAITVYDETEHLIEVGDGYGANLVSMMKAERLLGTLTEVRLGERTADPRFRIAHEAYSAASRVQSTDARFLLLMAAVEALTTRTPRSQAAQDHIDCLVGMTDTSVALEPREQNRLSNGLRGLKYESQRQLGRALASRLVGKTYQGALPVAFFNKCYGIRSSLVHPGTTPPLRDDVSVLVAHLKTFVEDLFALQPESDVRLHT